MELLLKLFADITIDPVEDLKQELILYHIAKFGDCFVLLYLMSKICPLGTSVKNNSQCCNRSKLAQRSVAV
jgi:hypothetical protein